MPLAAEHADAFRLELLAAEVRALAAVGTVAGVAVLAAAGRSGPGAGRLRSFGDGTRLAWQAPGSSVYGTPVLASADGDYLLEDGEDSSKWLRVRVDASRLGGPCESRVFLGDLFNNAIGSDDVSAAEATAGDVETFSFSLVNRGRIGLSQVKAWIDAAVGGLEISLDGLAWSAPVTEALALTFGDLAPGETKTLHLRRTIAAAAPSDPDILNQLHFSFQGV